MKSVASVHQAGSQLDFDEILRTQRARVSRALLRFGVHARDLPDAEQDVFMIVHRRLHEFEGRSQISTWLYRIAMNVASDHRRRAHHRRELFCEHSIDTARSQAQSTPEARDTLRHIASALDTLDDDKREVFLLYELEELGMSEIAARLRVPLKTAFSRLYAARRALLSVLRAQGVSLFALWQPSRLGDALFREAPLRAATRSAAWLAGVAQLGVLASVVLSVCLSPTRMQSPSAAGQAEARAATVTLPHPAPPLLAAVREGSRIEIELDVIEIRAEAQAAKRATKHASKPRAAPASPWLSPANSELTSAEPQLAFEALDLSYHHASSVDLRPRVLPDSAIASASALPSLPRIVVHGRLPTLLSRVDVAR